MTDSFEEEQRLLDPHRLDEQRRAREEMEDRLRDRGITVYPRDGDEEVGDLLEAIERFEALVDPRPHVTGTTTGPTGGRGARNGVPQ